MLILPQMVEIEWTLQKKWYIEKGYVFTNLGDKFLVNVEDLRKSQKVKVKVLCDYCLEKGIETVVEKQYLDYLNQRKTVAKDSCKICYPKKVVEVTLVKYGVSSTNKLNSVKQKKIETSQEKNGVDYYVQTEEYKERLIQTSLSKYGTEYPIMSQLVRGKIKSTVLNRFGVNNVFANKQIQRKIVQTLLSKYNVTSPLKNLSIKNKVFETNIKRYGYKNPMKNKEVVDKGIKTSIERYGFPHFSQSDLFLDKFIGTCLNNFGYPYPMQNPEILEKARRAQYLNGNMVCSKQQKYLHNLFGGELNYPINKFSLDIAFPEEMIYLEYDGGGHDLGVKLGSLTQLEFNNKEIRRYYLLKRQGWKQIKIISPKDYLPSDDILLEEYNKALEWFKSNEKYHSHYIIDIGTEIESDKYGHLRQLKYIS